ncbi:MAG: thiamine pyrophosphate-dependent dehydrogenase E1 component subunit alpha [Betaproteobacteria bacterium]
MTPIDRWRTMLLIRKFEEALDRRPDRGFQLFSSGEEAVAVGVCGALAGDDTLMCSGRSIGPALARGLDPADVMAELLGRSTGPCKGKGGRAHLAQPSAGFFGAHAVVGGNLCIAAGVALAMQRQRRSSVVAVLFGDGACGSGALHETLNIAALWKLPLLLVCDNNGYSVATPRAAALAPRQLSDLAKPFGIPGATVDGMDVMAVEGAARAFVERARSGSGPSLLECVSYRFATHSTSTRETRPAEELAAAKLRCPIVRYGIELETAGQLTAQLREKVEREVDEAVDRAISRAEAAPYPDRSEVLDDVL